MIETFKSILVNDYKDRWKSMKIYLANIDNNLKFPTFKIEIIYN